MGGIVGENGLHVTQAQADDGCRDQASSLGLLNGLVRGRSIGRETGLEHPLVVLILGEDLAVGRAGEVLQEFRSGRGQLRHGSKGRELLHPGNQRLRVTESERDGLQEGKLRRERTAFAGCAPLRVQGAGPLEQTISGLLEAEGEVATRRLLGGKRGMPRTPVSGGPPDRPLVEGQRLGAAALRGHPLGLHEIMQVGKVDGCIRTT